MLTVIEKNIDMKVISKTKNSNAKKKGMNVNRNISKEQDIKNSKIIRK